MRAERWWAVVAVSLLSASAFGEVAADLDWSSMPPLGPEKPYQPPRAVRSALDDGGVLLVIENHVLPLVTATFVMPGAGSGADPRGQAGLAAYAADLLDEGAGGLTARALAERLETLGSELRTWAEEDAAFVRVSALVRNFPASLELAAKALTEPAFSEQDGKRILDDQRAAVRLRRDRPGAVASVVFDAGLYGPAAPYGHPALGYLADLERIGVADARAFYRRRFQRQRLWVVVAGDITADEARRQVQRVLGGWKPAGEPVSETATAAAPASTARLLVIDRPGAEQANLIIGTLGLRRADDRSYALDILTNVLGGTFSSRLNHRLREQLGYTYGVDARAVYQRQAGAVQVATALSTPSTADGMREILRMLDQVARAPLSPAELSAAQLNLIRGLPLYFATDEDIADAFAGLALAGLGDDWFESYAARVRAVTAAEVMSVARLLLSPRRLLAVVVGPMAQVERDLARTGFGPPRRFDADGNPVGR